MTTVPLTSGSPVPTLGTRSVYRPGAAFSVPNLPSASGGGSLQVELSSMRSLLRLQESMSGSRVPPSLGSAAIPNAAMGRQIAVVSPGRQAGAENISRLIGRSIGTGQCVALVQAAAPEVGPTRGWSRGAPVRGNFALQPGTAIATFDASGQYANARDGSSHAAIYLGQVESGL